MTVHKDLLVPVLKVFKVHKVFKADLVTKDNLAEKVSKVFKVIKVFKVSRVLRDLVLRVLMDLDHRVVKVFRDYKAQAVM